MPELTGRTLEQIEVKLRDGQFPPHDFDRHGDRGAPTI